MQTPLDVTIQLLAQTLAVFVFPGILFITFLALLWQWIDRKVHARLQNRFGPLHTGWRGILQPLMDFLKLLGKEDLTPKAADRKSFAAVPVVMLILSLISAMFLPIVDMDPGTSGVQGILSFEGDLVFLLFLSTLMAVTIVLAGYFSSNRYGQTGSARTGMLLISFEIPLILALMTPALLTGSLRLSIITHKLSKLSPAYIWLMIIPVIIYVISLQAELERIPFDVSHAEVEIVHGWQVEFSGKKLAMINLAEDIMLVFGAGMVTALFLGGPLLLEFIPIPLFSVEFAGFMATEWVGWVYYTLVFMFKSTLVIIVLSNIRTAFARWRIDQIVRTAWKFMVPLAIINLVLVQVALTYIFPILGVV